MTIHTPYSSPLQSHWGLQVYDLLEEHKDFSYNYWKRQKWTFNTALFTTHKLKFRCQDLVTIFKK